MNRCSSWAVGVGCFSTCWGAAFGISIPIPVTLCVSQHSHGTAEFAAALPAGQNNTGSRCKGYLTRSRSFFPELEEQSSPALSPLPPPAFSSPLLHLPETCSRHLPGAKTIEKFGTDL